MSPRGRSRRPDRERVLGSLVRARLVTADDDSVELAHEALARAWPRLRSWLDEDAAGQRILRHLSAAADGWDSLGRPRRSSTAAPVWRPPQWRPRPPRTSPRERAFLDASIAESTAARERQSR